LRGARRAGGDIGLLWRDGDDFLAGQAETRLQAVAPCFAPAISATCRPRHRDLVRAAGVVIGKGRTFAAELLQPIGESHPKAVAQALALEPLGRRLADRVRRL
jgi:hypothetical protein